MIKTPRDIDALVAETIFGFKGVVVDQEHVWGAHRSPSQSEADAYLIHSVVNKYLPLDHYSTRMGSAWKVAEYICGDDPRNSNWSFKMEYCEYEKRFVVTFFSIREGISHTGQNSSPAMAICLAALQKADHDKEYAESKKNA